MLPLHQSTGDFFNGIGALASPLTHLKAYEIDWRLLRTGPANFSASGEQRQDNDLVVIESVEAAAGGKRVFDARYCGGEVLSLGAK